MTHSDEAPAGKRRRLGLWLPYAILGLLALAWSGGWLWAKGEVERRLDAAAAAHRAGGGQASWATRNVYGYPFRLDVDFTGLKVNDPSGWGVEIPTLKTEAYLFSPDHWIMAAPSGLALSRPGAGPVTVTASVLKASVSQLAAHPANLALVADNPIFQAKAGDAPFVLTSAKSLQLYARPGPDDQGAFYVQVDAGQPGPASLMTSLIGEGAFNARFDATFDHASALSGGWRAAFERWAVAGGRASPQHLELTSQEASLQAGAGGPLSVDPAGNWTGALNVTLQRIGGPAATTLPLTFSGGRARLGGVDIGPAPKAY